MTPPRLFYCATFLLCLSTPSGCGTTAKNGEGEGVVADSHQAGASADTLYYLDLNKPSIEHPIDIKVGANETLNFVQVEVTRVTNPRLHPLTFEVRYRSKDKVTIYLGSFSLYPSDNPGKFLVATQGKVRDTGAIIVSMVTSDKTDSTDVIKVSIKPPRLLEG
jgi:hypothetical protein